MVDNRGECRSRKVFRGCREGLLALEELSEKNFRLLSWFIRVPPEKSERIRLPKFSLTEDYCEDTLFRYDLRVES